jgi:hypothetical protein
MGNPAVGDAWDKDQLLQDDVQAGTLFEELSDLEAEHHQFEVTTRLLRERYSRHE